MARRDARTRQQVTSRETVSDRFEFARRHIVQQQKLEDKLDEARWERHNWYTHDADGLELIRKYPFSPAPKRKAKSPEERDEIKALEAAVVDARARLLLHENDGHLL